MNADRAAPHLKEVSNPGALAHTVEITHSWDAKTTVGAWLSILINITQIKTYRLGTPSYKLVYRPH